MSFKRVIDSYLDECLHKGVLGSSSELLQEVDVAGQQMGPRSGGPEGGPVNPKTPEVVPGGTTPKVPMPARFKSACHGRSYPPALFAGASKRAVPPARFRSASQLEAEDAIEDILQDMETVRDSLEEGKSGQRWGQVARSAGSSARRFARRIAGRNKLVTGTVAGTAGLYGAGKAAEKASSKAKGKTKNRLQKAGKGAKAAAIAVPASVLSAVSARGAGRRFLRSHSRRQGAKRLATMYHAKGPTSSARKGVRSARQKMAHKGYWKRTKQARKDMRAAAGLAALSGAAAGGAASSAKKEYKRQNKK